jgi:hypothetical protein
MNQTKGMGRQGRRRLAVVAGLAVTALLVVVVVVPSTSGSGDLGAFDPLGAAGAAAVHSVETQLLEDCFSLDQATALMSSALKEAGAPSVFVARTDGGIMSRTEEGAWEAVLRHLDQGCYTYTAASNDASGRRVFYFAGPETLRQAEAFWASQEN